MLEAVLCAFDPDWGADALNPVSALYGGRMVDPSLGLSVDLGRAALSGVSGRDRRLERRAELGDRALADRPARLDAARRAGARRCSPDAGAQDVDASQLGEGPEGYVVDRPMTPRAAIEPLAQAYAFDAAEHRGHAGVPSARRRAGRWN